MVVPKLTLALALATLLAVPAPLLAAPKDRYERVAAKYENIRLDGPRPTPLSQMRRAVAEFEAVAKRYPASGYSDNALFQAATIARAAHRVYESDVDRETAVRLLRWLVRGYPSSSLRPKAQKMLRDLPTERLARSTRKPGPSSRAAVQNAAATSAPRAETAAVTGTEPSAGASARVPGLVSLRDVKREIVGGAVRMTFLFDGEMAYRQEKLNNPARIYFDLDRTTAPPELLDAVMNFDGPGPRHVRLGRPREDTTRLVIDLEGIRSYSVFALYNPYRLTIDLHPVEPIAAPAPAALSARAPTRSVAPSSAAPSRTHVPAAPVALAAGTPLSTLARAFDAPEGLAVSALPPVEPPRLSPRPLPHPLSDRAFGPAARVAARPVTASLRVPLTGRRLLARRNIGLAKPVMARAVAAPVATWVAAERARRPAPPLAKRAVTPPALPAPEAPVPNTLGGFSMARQLGLNVSRIVIDAGHGGHDPGTIGSKTSEAAVVLDVALRLEKLLQAEQGFEVVMTRRTDVFIPLEERTALANKVDADLFLSIHVNASRNRQASGVETYFLNFANNAESEAVAARENATAARSMHHLPDMVRAITMNNKVDESRDFAHKVQDALVANLGKRSGDFRDRGVKQAPFVVLIGAGMPSVLAEIAFISHAEEGSRLRSGAYRQEIAEALFEAVLKYQRSLKAVGTMASQQ